MNRLLAIDIGNTNTAIAMFKNPQKKSKPLIFSLPTNPTGTDGEFSNLFAAGFRQIASAYSDSEPLASIVSSVAPSRNKMVSDIITSFCGKPPVFVDYRLDTGLSFNLEHPEKLGADRIVNAAAAYQQQRKPVAVADCGTATTLTVVAAEGNVLGGAIMPGVELMQKALCGRTEQLPLSPLAKPDSPLGKDTDKAIRSGVLYGTASAIEGIISRIEKEGGFKLELLITGGCSALIAPLIDRRCRRVPGLIFEGLRLIYLRNS